MTNNQSRTFFKTLHDEKLYRLEHPEVDTIVYRSIYSASSFLIALFIPVIGLCLYIVCKDERPRYALYPLMGTLTSFAFILTFTTLLIISQAYDINGVLVLQQILPEWANDFLIPFPRTAPKYAF